ncbi:hypothetical protein K439DRAFT_1615624 [Ramaria rubella]|nr:hypothetical protein K439DRAFT_1615624 [Ramaria rubella]
MPSFLLLVGTVDGDYKASVLTISTENRFRIPEDAAAPSANINGDPLYTLASSSYEIPTIVCGRLTAMIAFVTVILFLISAVAADTSLWIPDTDPQPISASVLGVGNDGRTTWQIQQGSATGTTTDIDASFTGTATLIEGPSNALLSLALTAEPADGGVTVAVDISCTINSSVAVCIGTNSEAGLVSTETETETVSPFLVQNGATSAVMNTGLTSHSPMQTGGVNSITQASGGSTPASSTAQATETAQKNSAQKHHVVNGLLGLVAAAGHGTIVYIM